MIRSALASTAIVVRQVANPAFAGAAWTLQQRLWISNPPQRFYSAAPRKVDDDEEPYVAPHPSVAEHRGKPPRLAADVPFDVNTVMANPAYYDINYLESVKPRHVPPTTVHQKVGYSVIQGVRRVFDLATGYNMDKMTEAQWLRRIIFLETVAGVPGMMAGMLRHLRSLRTMKRDNGWINTLLAEAENERMHLLTFMEMRKPGPLFRGMVLAAQGVSCNLFFLVYLVSPKTCHAAVGYLEEEAVKTYTHAIKEVDAGRLWPGMPAPAIAREYWRLAEGASMRDLLLAVRADEACHSHVNHTFSQIKADEPNPFGIGSHKVP